MLKQLIFLCFISLSNANRISLAGNDWTIKDSVNYTAQGSVPGTIHTILLAAKQIPDPYTGYNDVDLRFLLQKNWIFTKNFSLTPDFLASNKTFLHLEQIDTVSNVTINTCPVGKTNNMHVRYVFPVLDSCLKAENVIQFDFESPITYALEQSIAYNNNITVQPTCPPDIQKGICHIQFIRKEPCSFSWDWAPAFAPIGIPRDLYIEAHNSTDIVIQLESVNLAGFDKDKKLWQIDVILSSNNDKFDAKLKFVLENTTFTHESDQSFDHNLTISLTIPEDQVSRWWPNGHGDQPLYQLTVFNNGQEIDARILGFRTVELIQEAYGGAITGNSFYFSINSKPIYVKGSNWVPPDSFQERVDDTKLERLLHSAQVANMNMLRVWGGGIYERRTFYELADRLGIMIWQDFMFASSLYPTDDAFLSNVNDEILYQVKRLQHHPSIVIWAGNSKNELALAENWYNISSDRLNQTKDEYRKLYVDTIMKAVQQVDKGNNRPFVTSSPSNGVETVNENYIATNPQSPFYGDVHYYPREDDSWNITTYPITRFLSKTGTQSLPSLEAWNQIVINPTDLKFNSSFVVNRERSINDYPQMIIQMETNLPLPITNDPIKSFSQMIYLSQIHQAITLKSLSDLCRIHSSKDAIDPRTSQGHTMGFMYWQLNDIWQAQTWSTIEYGLKWKLSHYYVRHMYAPIYPVVTLTPNLASVIDESAQISLHVVNDLYNSTRGDLICGLYSLYTFTPRLTFGGDVSFTAPGVQHVMNIQYSKLMNRTNCTNNPQCIIHCSFIMSQSVVGQTLFLNRPKSYTYFNPNLKIFNVTSISPNDFNIIITADLPALFVWLDVVPSTNVTGYFSRNGFHMFEPIITVSFHSWVPIANLPLSLPISLFDIREA